MYDIVHKESSAAELMSICKLLLSQFNGLLWGIEPPSSGRTATPVPPAVKVFHTFGDQDGSILSLHQILMAVTKSLATFC